MGLRPPCAEEKFLVGGGKNAKKGKDIPNLTRKKKGDTGGRGEPR